MCQIQRAPVVWLWSCHKFYGTCSFYIDIGHLDVLGFYSTFYFVFCPLYFVFCILHFVLFCILCFAFCFQSSPQEISIFKTKYLVDVLSWVSADLPSSILNPDFSSRGDNTYTIILQLKVSLHLIRIFTPWAPSGQLLWHCCWKLLVNKSSGMQLLVKAEHWGSLFQWE